MFFTLDRSQCITIQDGVSIDEEVNCIHWTKNRICFKFAWCKYVANMKFAQLCNQCKGGDERICTKTSKFGHHHTCTGCKGLQSTYLQHICNKFAQGKFYANSFFRPVICTKYISSLSAPIDFFYLCFYYESHYL